MKEELKDVLQLSIVAIIPHRFVWLKPNLFAVSMEARRSREGNFVFIDLKEGEGK